MGAAIPHDSARKHVTGQAVYVDDSPPYTGQLYACIGSSNVARGILNSLDLAPVRAAEGVVDVITAKDIPGKLDIGPVFPGDPLLVDTEIEYHGQPLYAVLATSHDLARKAARLGQARVEVLEPVLDLQQAIEQKYYVRPPHRMQRGDVDPALENSFHRFQGTLRIGGQEHFYLEGQASIAIPEEDGGVTIHTSTQNPTEEYPFMPVSHWTKSPLDPLGIPTGSP